MPYKVEKDTTACPRPSKPWATKNQATGRVYGCHGSRAEALAQSAALYASESKSEANMAALELRESRDGAAWHLSGVASTYGKPYKVTDQSGSYRETIARGAFAGALTGRDEVELHVQHMRGAPLAATGTSGTMTMLDSDHGLLLDATLPKSDPDCVAAVTKAQRGILSGLSVGMVINRDSWSDTRSSRTIQAATLHEVSLVSKPANPGALVSSVRGRSGQLEVRYCGSLAVVGRQMDAEPDGDEDGMVVCIHCGGDGRVDGGVCPACDGDGMVPADEDQDGRAARAGYAAHELAQLGAKGAAFKNPDGHWSFPTRTPGDLQDAIQAIGRAPAPLRAAVRRYIMARARKMGLTHLIPDTWASDGSLRSGRSRVRLAGGLDDPEELAFRSEMARAGFAGVGSGLLAPNDTHALRAELANLNSEWRFINEVAAFRRSRQ